MNLTDKEIEFLKEIYETQERGDTITFSYGEEEKEEMYQKKYGDVYKSLEYSNLIIGCIKIGSGLKLTTKGKEELEKALLKKETELERKNLELSVKNTEWTLKTKWIVLLGVIVGILGWILALVQFIFCASCT